MNVWHTGHEKGTLRFDFVECLIGFSTYTVGKVEFLNLYPLNFMEFLEATGNKQLSELIIKKDFELMKAFKDKFIEQLKHYYFVVGNEGMAIPKFKLFYLNIIFKIIEQSP